MILSAAVLSQCKDADNTLVLVAEFALSDDMRDALSRVFSRVIVVRDQFYKPTSALDDVREIRCLLRKVKGIRREWFDRVYLSQERIFDKIVCRWVKRNNPQAYCCHMEEDVYYSLNETYNADDFVYPDGWRMKRHRRRYALCLLGYPYDYQEVTYCYGMSRIYDGAAVLFPPLVRKEVAGKELREITKDELLAGIRALYAHKTVTYPPARKYLLFFFDLMERYNDPERVKALVHEMVRIAQTEGRTVLFKYHPRETDKFDAMAGTVELPHLIPAEKVLADLQDTDTVVVGNATTSCIVAAKLGFRTYSICKLEIPTNRKMHEKMTDMGLSCVTNIDEVLL